MESPTAPGPLALTTSRCFRQVPSCTYCPKSQKSQGTLGLGRGLESSPGHRHCGGQPCASSSFQELEFFPHASPALLQPYLRPPVFNVIEFGKNPLIISITHESQQNQREKINYAVNKMEEKKAERMRKIAW